jgi:hypothetical protein
VWRKQGVNKFLPPLLTTGLEVCGLGLCGFLVLALGACSRQPEPESVAAQQVAAAAAEAARTATEEAERRAEEPPGEEPLRKKIVVIQAGGDSHTPTPAELSAQARAERAAHGDRSVGELTDKNLAEVASQGKLTYASEPADRKRAQDGAQDSEDGAPADGAVASADTGAGEIAGSADDEDCGETCWRRRARELRQAWADAAAEIKDLEAEVADLRWQFYATDDPWQRDSQIKPRWDRALDRLHRTRDEVDRYRQRVDELMDEGRRAGALPGWLRDGVELEPEPATKPAQGPDPAEPVEPPLSGQEPREPGRS